MKTSTFRWLGAALTAATLATASDAATYAFSFSNEDGDLAGTVFGLIELPDGDFYEVPATSVRVTSGPAALGQTYPLEFVSPSYTEIGNNFRVSGGTITMASFAATGSGHSLWFSLDHLILFGAGRNVRDVDGSTLALSAATVPLPAGAMLLVTGLAGLALTRRRAA